MWIHSTSFCQGLGLRPFQWRFLANNELGCKWNSLCDCMFVPKEGGTVPTIGWTLKNIHALLANLWAVFMFYASTYSCHIIWNFEYTKTVTLHCSKSGRWYCPISCNWGKPFWVNLTSVFADIVPSQASSLAFVSRYKIFWHSWLIGCDPNSKWQFPLHIIRVCMWLQ